MVSAEGRAGEAAGLRRALRLAPLRLARRDAAPALPAVRVPEALSHTAMGMAMRTARAQDGRSCHLTHKSATWAKICVKNAKWRIYASNSR